MANLHANKKPKRKNSSKHIRKMLKRFNALGGRYDRRAINFVSKIRRRMKNV